MINLEERGTDYSNGEAVQIWAKDAPARHVAGYWFSIISEEKEAPWTLYFPSSNSWFYFKDRETLLTFLSLHWEEYKID